MYISSPVFKKVHDGLTLDIFITLILSDVMGASSMLFVPLCVSWIYSKLFMVPPYFKEEKLRLVFYLHVKDKLNLTSLITADC